MPRKNAIAPKDAEIAKRLLAYRLMKGWKRTEMAARTGVDTSRLANYEQCKAALPYAVADQICRKLDISQMWLSTGEGYDFPFRAPEELGLSDATLKASQHKRFSAVMESVGWATETALTEMLVAKGVISPTTLEAADRDGFTIFAEYWRKKIPESYWGLFLSDLTAVARAIERRLKRTRDGGASRAEADVKQGGHGHDAQARLTTVEPAAIGDVDMLAPTKTKALMTRLRRLMREKKITQTAVAQAVGVTRQAASLWFNKGGSPSGEVALRLDGWLRERGF